MKHPVNLHIGKRLRQRRWRQGLTQDQLAQTAGIRFQQVQKYEFGTSLITAARLWELARALDAPLSYFFEGLEPGAEPQPDEDSAFRSNQKETAELIRAFHAMPEGPRRQLLELAKAVANQDHPQGANTFAHSDRNLTL
jgi:transcriptional regulator with XRE-family HTH domain